MSSSTLDSKPDQNEFHYTYQNGVLTCEGPEQLRDGPLKDSSVLYVQEDNTSSKYTHRALQFPPKDESNDESIDVIMHVYLCNPPSEFLARHLLPQNLLPRHLRLPSEDVHVIISTKSGLGKAKDFSDQILLPAYDLAAGRDLGDPESYTVLATTNEQSIRKFARDVLKPKADKGIPQTVILLSGDGGVVDIINELAGDEERPT
jgi:hypothetical protein